MTYADSPWKVARSTSRGSTPPVKWSTHPRSAGLGTIAADVALAAGTVCPEVPCPLLAGSLVRTCSARVACRYLVPLMVTTKDEPGPAAYAGPGAAADGTAAGPAALL